MRTLKILNLFLQLVMRGVLIFLVWVFGTFATLIGLATFAIRVLGVTDTRDILGFVIMGAIACAVIFVWLRSLWDDAQEIVDHRNEE